MPMAKSATLKRRTNSRTSNWIGVTNNEHDWMRPKTIYENSDERIWQSYLSNVSKNKLNFSLKENCIRASSSEDSVKMMVPYFAITNYPTPELKAKAKPLKEFLLIDFGDGETLKINKTLLDVFQKIEESRYLLDFKENWDDEGSPAYLLSTWKKAVKFVANYTGLIYETFLKSIPTPEIYHSFNGSIDILWKSDKYQLLINIPADNSPAKFYGDNYLLDKIQGSFDPANYNQGLILSLLAQ